MHDVREARAAHLPYGWGVAEGSGIFVCTEHCRDTCGRERNRAFEEASKTPSAVDRIVDLMYELSSVIQVDTLG